MFKYLLLPRPVWKEDGYLSVATLHINYNIIVVSTDLTHGPNFKIQSLRIRKNHSCDFRIYDWYHVIILIALMVSYHALPSLLREVALR